MDFHLEILKNLCKSHSYIDFVVSSNSWTHLTSTPNTPNSPNSPNSTHLTPKLFRFDQSTLPTSWELSWLIKAFARCCWLPSLFPPFFPLCMCSFLSDYHVLRKVDPSIHPSIHRILVENLENDCWYIKVWTSTAEKIVLRRIWTFDPEIDLLSWSGFWIHIFLLCSTSIMFKLEIDSSLLFKKK